MANLRKRIGVFITQPESYYQSQVLHGIADEALKNDMDVLIFAAFIKSGGAKGFQEGESNIFRLPNPDKLDAVIVISDVIQMDKAKENIADFLDKFKGSVVIADDYSSEYPYVIGSEEKEIYDLTSHLVKIHGYRSIAYVTGPKGHPHAENRLKYFRSAMTDLNAPVDESMIFYGDFWYDCGDEIVANLMSRDKLPDAIACASDTMALSVIRAFEKRGVNVPENIAVVGFDCNGDGIDKRYSVTSIVKSNETTGRNAVLKLISIINGIPFTPVNHDVNMFITDSCGCPRREPMTESGSSYIYNCPYDNPNGFYSGYNFMVEKTIGSKSIEECLWVIDWYTYHIGTFDGFYICLCDNWDSPEHDAEGTYIVDGYTEKITLAHIKLPNWHSVDLKRKFSLSDMLPILYSKRDTPSIFLFTPLHFLDRCFGYTCLMLNSPNLILSLKMSQWMRNVNNSLESLRRQTNLMYMYKKMEENAVTDLPTGLFNRNGFNIYAPQMLKEAEAGDMQVLAILGDLNCLKYINDTYGHNAGDEAIKKAAEAFIHSIEETDERHRNFRIGGDEFVQMIIGDLTAEMVDEQIIKIRKYLDNFNMHSNLPYPVQLSLGVVYQKADKSLTVDNIISAADREMFVDKQRVKAQTGFIHDRT